MIAVALVLRDGAQRPHVRYSLEILAAETSDAVVRRCGDRRVHASPVDRGPAGQRPSAGDCAIRRGFVTSAPPARDDVPRRRRSACAPASSRCPGPARATLVARPWRSGIASRRRQPWPHDDRARTSKCPVAIKAAASSGTPATIYGGSRGVLGSSARGVCAAGSTRAPSVRSSSTVTSVPGSGGGVVSGRWARMVSPAWSVSS
jgi:hypothetical protein